MTTTSMLPDVGIELREGYAEVGDVNLHYVEAGDGPLIVLLHGFPEFWFGWRLQIEPLVGGRFSGGRPRHAWLQPVIEARGLRGLRRRPARRRYPRPDRRTRCRVRVVGRSRLGRIHRLDHRDEPPRGGRPTRHPQRGPSAAALGGTAPPEPASEVLVLLLLCDHRDCPRKWCTPETGTSSGTSWRTRTRLTPTRKSNATSRRGRSQGQRPG